MTSILKSWMLKLQNLGAWKNELIIRAGIFGNTRDIKRGGRMLALYS
ncbi:hypothetical protein ES705_17141 [subsurface metagenome]